MEIRHMIWFKVLAETENMTKAAEKLFISQPHLSRCLNELEEELGAKLFDRVGRGIVLNPIGMQFYNDVMTFFHLYEDSKHKIAEMAQRQNHNVSVITNVSTYTPKLLKWVIARYPDLNIQQYSARRRTMIKKLLSDEVDFAICCPPLTEHPDIDTHLVRVEEGVAVYPKGHWFETLEEVPFSEIVKEKVICSPPGYGTRDTVDLCLHKLGLHLQAVIETSDTSTIYEYINEGLGIALAPKSITEFVYGPEKRYVKISEEPKAEIAISWRKGHYMTDAAQRFIKETIHFFDEMDSAMIDYSKKYIGFQTIE